MSSCKFFYNLQSLSVVAPVLWREVVIHFVLLHAVYRSGVVCLAYHRGELSARSVGFRSIYESIPELNLVSSSAVWLKVFPHLVLVGDADVF